MIRKNVYVAPLVSIRADEGTPFYIGSNTNLQDGVILHGLLNKFVCVDEKDYSIFISREATIAHGALVHGPCYIGDKVLVGFKTIVYDAIVEKGVFISNNAVVTNGIHIAKNRFVPPGAYIDSQKKLMHFQKYLLTVKSLQMKYSGSIRNFPPHIIYYLGKIVVHVKLHITITAKVIQNNFKLGTSGPFIHGLLRAYV